MSVSHVSTLEAALTALANGQNRDPFAVLGPHIDESGRGQIVRVFQPAARSVEIRLPDGSLVPTKALSPAGAFEASLGAHVPWYRVRATFPSGDVHEYDDPYR